MNLMVTLVLSFFFKTNFNCLTLHCRNPIFDLPLVLLTQFSFREFLCKHYQVDRELVTHSVILTRDIVAFRYKLNSCSMLNTFYGYNSIMVTLSASVFMTLTLTKSFSQTRLVDYIPWLLWIHFICFSAHFELVGAMSPSLKIRGFNQNNVKGDIATEKIYIVKSTLSFFIWVNWE